MPHLSALLDQSFAMQKQAVEHWHEKGFDTIDLRLEFSTQASSEQVPLTDLILEQHRSNFDLWHVEDIARRKDVNSDIIAQCKFKIDALNQLRNNLIEEIDNRIIQLISPPLLQNSEGSNLATETLGMCIDRMSILSLKIYHMEEQTRRCDVSQEHVDNCSSKLAVLSEQREDLSAASLNLLNDFLSGHKTPKIYRQFKMYNDPSLNPQLYAEPNTASLES